MKQFSSESEAELEIIKNISSSVNELKLNLERRNTSSTPNSNKEINYESQNNKIKNFFESISSLSENSNCTTSISTIHSLVETDLTYSNVNINSKNALENVLSNDDFTPKRTCLNQVGKFRKHGKLFRQEAICVKDDNDVKVIQNRLKKLENHSDDDAAVFSDDSENSSLSFDSNVQGLKCRFCSKIFLSKNILNLHFANSHYDAFRTRCCKRCLRIRSSVDSLNENSNLGK